MLIRKLISLLILMLLISIASSANAQVLPYHEVFGTDNGGSYFFDDTPTCIDLIADGHIISGIRNYNVFS